MNDVPEALLWAGPDARGFEYGDQAQMLVGERVMTGIEEGPWTQPKDTRTRRSLPAEKR